MAFKEVIIAAALSTSPEASTFDKGEKIINQGSKEIAQKMFEYSKKTGNIHYDSQKKIITLKSENQRFKPFLVAGASDEQIYKLMSDEKVKEYIIGDVMYKIDAEINNIKDLLEEIKEENNREEILSDIEYEIRQLDKNSIRESLIELGFNDNFINNIINIISKIETSDYKVDINRLNNLATITYEDALKKYLETGTVTSGFESFKEDFEEIKKLEEKIKDLTEKIKKSKQINKLLKKRGNDIDKFIKKIQNIKNNMANRRNA